MFSLHLGFNLIQKFYCHEISGSENLIDSRFRANKNQTQVSVMSKNGSVFSHHIWSSVALTFILCWISCPSHERLLCGPACSHPLVLLLFSVLPLFVGILVCIERKMEF